METLRRHNVLRRGKDLPCPVDMLSLCHTLSPAALTAASSLSLDPREMALYDSIRPAHLGQSETCLSSFSFQGEGSSPSRYTESN